VIAKAAIARLSDQDIPSIVRDGDTGKRVSGAQLRMLLDVGMSDLAIQTNTNPEINATTARKPWMLNLGLTRRRMSMAIAVMMNKNIVRNMNMQVACV
jgi:hypothetical protein